MAKVSRPIIYVAVLGVVAYAAVLLTEPEAPPKKSAKSSRTVGETRRPEAIPKFERYNEGKQNAFRPKVVTSRAGVGKGEVVLGPGETASAGTSVPAPLLPTGWYLTGVNSINGQRSALIENGPNGQTEFLTVGDRWNGMTVAAINANAVILTNGQGQELRITFPKPPDEKTPKTVTASPGASPVPSPTSNNSRRDGG